MGNKRLNVSEDTQIHVTTTYTRNKGNKKANSKKAFNWVIKGLLISSTLVGSVVTTGLPAYASEAKPVASVTYEVSAKDVYQDEVAMISNLKMANKVLEASIKQGQLNTSVYETVMKRLVAIDTKIMTDKEFNKVEELLPVLDLTDSILKSDIKTTNKDIIAKRKVSIEALESVQNKLGIKSAYKDQLTTNNVVTVASTSAPAPASSKVTTASVKQQVKYNDYKANEYWSQDMLWAIDSGLIQGYLNTTHPTNKNIKTVGNWLNPDGALSEAQMLTVIFRYSKPTELANTKPQDAKWYASVPYQLASKYKVTTVASLSNKSKAGGVVTRGSLAKAIATVHYGKPVTEEQAIKFMYDAGITTGINPSKGKTVANFGAKDPLKRAHIVSFMKRYDTYLAKSGAQQPTNQPTTNPSTGQEVNGIKVEFGKHHYGSKNQSQYDQVMKIIRNAVKNASYELKNGETGISLTTIDAYFNGERGTMDRNHPDFRTDRNGELVNFGGLYGKMIENGMTKEQIFEYDGLLYAAKGLSGGAEYVNDGTPESAYDALVRKVTDCDPDAQIISAIFDSKGYTTAILARPGHAYAIVKINGKWFSTQTNDVVNFKEYFDAGVHVHTQPTDGTIITK